MDKLRRCIVTESKNKSYEAYFHRWMEESYVVEASPLIGGAPAGQVTLTRAIVEDEVGQVHVVHPTCIKFI